MILNLCCDVRSAMGSREGDVPTVSISHGFEELAHAQRAAKLD